MTMGCRLLLLWMVCVPSIFALEKAVFYKITYGLNTSYLFGTYSSSDPRALDLPDEVFHAFLASDQLVTELSFDGLDSFTALPKVFLPEDKTLRSIVDDETWQNLERLFERFTFPFSLQDLNNRQPWFVMSELTDQVQILQLPEGQQPLPDQDVFLFSAAQERGMLARGLMSPVEKIDVFLSFSDQLNQLMIASAVEDLLSYSVDQQDPFLEWYLSGANMGSFEDFLLAESPEEQELSDVFINKLFYQRVPVLGQNMLDVINSDRQNVYFFALPVGLLLGQINLIDFLQDQGVQVTPYDRYRQNSFDLDGES